MPTNKQDRRDFLRRGTMAAVALSSTGALGQDGPASSREHHNAGDGRDLGTDAEIEHRHAHVKADYDGFSRYKPTRGNDPESDLEAYWGDSPRAKRTSAFGECCPACALVSG